MESGIKRGFSWKILKKATSSLCFVRLLLRLKRKGGKITPFLFGHKIQQILFILKIGLTGWLCFGLRTGLNNQPGGYHFFPINLFNHTGHIQFFSASKQLGDVLIVAIDDDDSVKQLKGAGRPLIGDRQRARILSSLDCIDYVTVFSSKQLEKLIHIIRPDVLTKGSNYTQEKVFGHDIVKQAGGRVVLIPVTDDVSSSRIINSIKDGGNSF